MHPDVTIKANHACTQAQIDDLDADRLDVGFLTGPWSNPDYETWEVQTDGFAAVLPERHGLASKAALTLRDFREESFVMGEPHLWAHFDAHLQTICREVGFAPRVVQYASNNEAILGLVACGMGVSIQAETIRMSQRHGVVIRRIDGDFPRVPTIAAWRPDSDNAVKMRLVDHVKALYATPKRADELSPR
jgi:DNA-binding transcriptional LysR family regulator